MFAVLSYEIGREVESLRFEATFSTRQDAWNCANEANETHIRNGSPIRFQVESY